ncbi:copper chaperone PCu(A)C [Marinactinospora thermotolerans]|uniref:Copper(I)-binding protein n=1 Tax=Marinactinospora thermotolerans DSM 45154 TaxID=1122192 RepID=A0A1T4NFT4_9ACTN|nr:copper chaperone PCu(A)C [Marinactinospora thermotolerans]SJZ77857.1 hypothetical protein SAMN02745673_01417 [Marinactinospora thermotolerans DSM 45154]
MAHIPRITPLATASATFLALALLSGCAGGVSAPSSSPSSAAPSGPAKGGAQQADLRVEEAWIVEPAEEGTTSAYFTVFNDAEQDDPLVAAESSVSATTALYTTSSKGMEVVEEIPVPAGGGTELRPDGFHLMLEGIEDPIAAGDTVTLTLTFAGGTEIQVDTPVLERSVGEQGEEPEGGHEGHSGHH